ncbi:hypothetical protein [Kitasatospora sp. NPDC007106]|uniref:hypothetical protein n=1 Tax=Kitasatospora sp. NPDC007106 TaxID=3156914 RepID=UPI0033FB6C36
MSSIDRRITGVTVTYCREYKVEVPKTATTAAREKLKQLRNDAARRARGRGKAPAATPEHLRTMNTPRLVPGHRARGAGDAKTNS